MPQIIKIFKSITPTDIEHWQGQTMLIRKPDVETIPLLGDIYGKKNVLFILSTSESDQEGHTALKSFIKNHQSNDFSSATIVEDTVALKMDLSKYHLFVVGTPSGNCFLQKVLQALPVRITTKEVIAGKKYEGNGYVFMSGWPNPYNQNHVMAIYTAQSPKDLINFTTIPRGSTHYHLSKGLITIKAENYLRRNLIWSCE
jgi:hypothetical protein